MFTVKDRQLCLSHVLVILRSIGLNTIETFEYLLTTGSEERGVL